MIERQSLALLEDRPVFEGDILYGLDGRRLQAGRPNRRDCQFSMVVLDKQPGEPDLWATDTHWKGQQVLFWSVGDIPAPKDRTLFTRLSEQIEANKKRKENKTRR